MERNHSEEHNVARVGWLRAAVLGANDGIISTAALIMRVAAASGRTEVLVAGIAGLAAGALAARFAVGAALPLAMAALVPEVAISLWGAVAMAVTALVGTLFGAVV